MDTDVPPLPLFELNGFFKKKKKRRFKRKDVSSCGNEWTQVHLAVVNVGARRASVLCPLDSGAP